MGSWAARGPKEAEVSLRSAVASAAVCAILVCSVAHAAEAPEALFRMAILSDRTGGHTPGVYPKIIEAINLLNPDLVVTVGDYIEGYGEDYERAHAEWDSVLALLRGLEAPVYFTPGNHDIWDAESEAIYRDKTGRAPFYSFDYKGTHFVVLDNSRIESWDMLSGRQFAWILADLAGTDAKNTFVFFHKPFWDQTLRRGKPDRLHEIFVQNGVDAVFCGHYHRCFAGTFDGIQYVAVGSSGGVVYEDVPQPELVGEFFQFAWVTVYESDQDIALVKHEGVVPHDLVTTDLLNEIERIQTELVELSPVELTEGDAHWAPVTLSIENAGDAPMEGEVEWDVPEGWEMEIPEGGFAIPAGGREEIEFRVLNAGSLYPAPEMSMGYPLADGRTFKLELPLPVVREIAVPGHEEAPVVDGDLSDGFWKQGASVTELYTGAGYSPVDGDTKFTFGHDAENLYVAAVCADDSMDQLYTGTGERDGAVYLDDCVGFFLQPDPEEMVVYQVYVNADGTVFDQKITFDEHMWWTTDPTWNGEYDVATMRGADRWTAEIAIPFSVLEADVSAHPTWKLNFRRKQHRTTGAADWQVPIDYNPETFGRIDLR